MDFIQIISGPIIGAVIGYITNDIAIRMLFRPHKAIYIGKWRLPFTPGIVPRRKDQLARILGEAIVEKFFNADDLEIVFTTGIADAVTDRLLALLKSDASLSALDSYVPAEAAEKLERELCIRIEAAVCTSSLPEVFAREGGRMAVSRLSSSEAVRNLADSASATLARDIREFIIEHGHEYILPMLHGEIERLTHVPLCHLTAALVGEHEEELRKAIKELYLRFMASHVRPIVESIDVGGMITDKIILMSSEEVEDLVLTVVKRELRLVVLFGAFVGALIGVVNIII